MIFEKYFYMINAPEEIFNSLTPQTFPEFLLAEISPQLDSFRINAQSFIEINIHMYIIAIYNEGWAWYPAPDIGFCRVSDFCMPYIRYIRPSGSQINQYPAKKSDQAHLWSR